MQVSVIMQPGITMGCFWGDYWPELAALSGNKIILEFTAKRFGGPRIQKEGGHQEILPVGLLQSLKGYYPESPRIGTIREHQKRETFIAPRTHRTSIPGPALHGFEALLKFQSNTTLFNFEMKWKI